VSYFFFSPSPNWKWETFWVVLGKTFPSTFSPFLPPPKLPDEYRQPARADNVASFTPYFPFPKEVVGD